MAGPVPHYVTIAGGQLRFFRIGEGPVLLALADPLLAAGILASRLSLLCPRHRILVVELPGIGGSSEIDPGSVPEMAGKIAEALDGLTAPVSVLLGFQLSCPVAAALAPLLPGEPQLLLAGLDALEGWRSAGIATPDLAPRQDGTHLQALWSFIRDRHLLVPGDPGQPASQGEPLPGDHDLSETFNAAAVRPDRFYRLWENCVRVTEDPLPPGTRQLALLGELASIPAEPESSRPDAALPPTAARPDRAIWHRYVETPRGRFHLRCAGEDGTPLLVIPTGGGSSAQFAPVIAGLAQGRKVFAIDYPGNGLSFKPAWPVTIESLAADVLCLLDTMELERVDVWGSHTGALVALELAVTAPERVGRMVMEGPVFISPDFQADLLANYFPPIRPDRWGLHIPQIWNWRRDLFMYWPWYRVDRAATRQLGVPDAWELHKYAIGILESGETYDGAYRSAFAYNTRARMPILDRPTLVCAGPNDMLKDGLAEAGKLGRRECVTVTETPTTVWWPDPEPGAARETLELYDRFLRG